MRNNVLLFLLCLSVVTFPLWIRLVCLVLVVPLARIAGTL